MSFDSVNARRSLRRRGYLTPLPEASGEFTQAERQQLRWLYSGLLLDIVAPFESEPLSAVVLVGRNLVGVVSAGRNLTGRVV